jgi:hypothetical protein
MSVRHRVVGSSGKVGISGEVPKPRTSLRVRGSERFAPIGYFFFAFFLAAGFAAAFFLGVAFAGAAAAAFGLPKMAS